MSGREDCRKTGFQKKGENLRSTAEKEFWWLEEEKKP